MSFPQYIHPLGSPEKDLAQLSLALTQRDTKMFKNTTFFNTLS